MIAASHCVLGATDLPRSGLRIQPRALAWALALGYSYENIALKVATDVVTSRIRRVDVTDRVNESR
jgi:hypothetical protein